MHTSRQLSEWHAYERAYGPIDDTWQNETLAQMHELLQNLIAVQSEGGSKPHTHQRPGSLWDVEEEDERTDEGDALSHSSSFGDGTSDDGEPVYEGLIPDEFFEGKE